MFDDEKPVAEEINEEVDENSATKAAAASKRKMFQKTRSRRNWSLCGSAEEDVNPSSASNEWVTKSMDDSLNRDDSLGREDSTRGDDTLNRLAYFSTTTESSTDSLDGKSSETEKALEEIRRQYNEGQLAKNRRERRSSSEDLFLPNRNAQERLPKEVRIREDSDDLDNVENCVDSLSVRSSNYFISPSSSRQTTIEKQSSCDPSAIDDDINNDTNNNKAHVIEEEMINKKSTITVSSIPFSNSKAHYESKLKAATQTNSAPASFDQNASNSSNNSTSASVQIIVSGSSFGTSGSGSGSTDVWLKSQSSDSDPTSSSGLLSVTNNTGIQRAGSDSGSSSSGSGTAVGSSSVLATADDVENLRTSESESSVTERDSISRTNSPCNFHLSSNSGLSSDGASSNSNRTRRLSPAKEMISIACQTNVEELDLVGGTHGVIVPNINISSNSDEDGLSCRNFGDVDSAIVHNSSVINLKVMKKDDGGTEFVLQDANNNDDDDDVSGQELRGERFIVIDENDKSKREVSNEFLTIN